MRMFTGLRLHAFVVKFPLIRNNGDSSFFDKQVRMRGGWVKFEKSFDDGVRIEVTSRSVLIFFKEENIDFNLRSWDSVRFLRWKRAKEVGKKTFNEYVKDLQVAIRRGKRMLAILNEYA